MPTIQSDTTLQLNDSAQNLSLDSLARIDSLRIADSISVQDSLKALIEIPRGYLGVSHPSLPHNEDWVFGTLLVLFFLLVFSLMSSAGFVSETLSSFFQVKDRTSIFSKTTINDFKIRFFLSLFSIGVFSLYAHYALFVPDTEFSFNTFLLVLAATLLFFGLKSLLFELIGYVFFDNKSLRMGKESYYNIISILGIFLFPLLILHIYAPDNLHYAVGIVSVIVCISGVILVIFKVFQIFFHKIVASFYILLYLCTLEFLPLIALYLVYKLII